MRAESPPSLIALALTALALFLTGVGTARAQEAVTAEIYEFGLYELGPVTSADPPSEYGVERLFGETITLLESTREVPGRVGVSFGIRYTISAGTFSGTPVPITIIVRYPPQGLYNPERSGPSYTDEQTNIRLTGEESFFTWDFFEQWHIEPGIWTIELWNGNEKLAEEWFEVVTPPIS